MLHLDKYGKCQTILKTLSATVLPAQRGALPSDTLTAEDLPWVKVAFRSYDYSPMTTIFKKPYSCCFLVRVAPAERVNRFTILDITRVPQWVAALGKVVSLS